jgi:riboflavin kinase/FMN adenylyltransferase
MTWIQTDYRGLAHAGQEGLPLRQNKGIVVIGNFDGVHCGHQALFNFAKDIAAQEPLPITALTFTPHPRRYFQPDTPPFQLTDSPQRYHFLQDAGAACVIDLNFDAILAKTSPEDFVHFILVGALHAKHVVIGDNFSFGCDRTGNIALLETLGEQYGFKVHAVPLVLDGLGMRYSSQRVRDTIKLGHMVSAAEQLGRPWQTRAEVIIGDKRGRTIGFPTANMNISQYTPAQYGVYAAQVRIEEETFWRPAVLNFGIRPSFALSVPLCEAHLLDFDDDLYKKNLHVAWYDFIRPEKRFTSLDLLKEQLHEDVSSAKTILALIDT